MRNERRATGDMLEAIFTATKTDTHLENLLAGVKEYADVYVLARQRQKDCDGMGGLATMKKEFRDVVY
jgi:hypothetical protein